MAREMWENGRVQEALKSFQEAYRQRPNAKLLINIGRCQHRLLQYPAALVSYQTAQSRVALGELTEQEQQTLARFIQEARQPEKTPPRAVTAAQKNRAAVGRLGPQLGRDVTIIDSYELESHDVDSHDTGSRNPTVGSHNQDSHDLGLGNTTIGSHETTNERSNKLKCRFHGSNNFCGDVTINHRSPWWLWTALGVVVAGGVVAGVAVASSPRPLALPADAPAFRPF
jgi:hypothetical protein